VPQERVSSQIRNGTMRNAEREMMNAVVKAKSIRALMVPEKLRVKSI
jgi:hypothetical protein